MADEYLIDAQNLKMLDRVQMSSEKEPVSVLLEREQQRQFEDVLARDGLGENDAQARSELERQNEKLVSLLQDLQSL